MNRLRFDSTRILWTLSPGNNKEDNPITEKTSTISKQKIKIKFKGSLRDVIKNKL